MGFDRRFGWRPWGGVSGLAAMAAVMLVLAAPVALAASNHVVEPHPWQLGFQEAATPVKHAIESLHDKLLVIITVISLFVMGLLVYVIVRFNERANPVPTRTSHNTFVEIAWTVVPILILGYIAIYSFKLMYYMDKTQNAEMTVKVTGHQWYWSYEYPDYDNVGFDSRLIDEKDRKPEDKRLLDVDQRLVVPVGTNVRVLIAGTDVMHSWFMPSFGVQMYAVVGRTNESWFNVDREGVYYGQCNQICGVNHAFMPIVVEAVSKDDFKKWVEAKKKEARDNAAPAPAQHAAASGSAEPVRVAAAAQ